MRTRPWNKILTDEDEKLIVKLYTEGNLSAPRILCELNDKVKTTKTIYDILKKFDVITKDTSFYNSVNHFYFSNIDNPKKAYVLGLMISDGWVHINRNQVGIQLQECDEYIIDFVKKEFETENKIVTCDKKPFAGENGKIYYPQKMKRIMVNSKKMIDDLSKYGVVERKSLKTVFPIMCDFKSHILRGILDGDGSICINSGRETKSIRFIGSCFLTAQISQFLYTELGVKFAFPSLSGNISCVGWYKKEDFEKIIDFLYKDKEESCFLERKYEIAKS